MIRRLPALLCLLLAAQLPAQEPQNPPPAAQQGDTTPTAIQAAIDQVKADTSLTDELRNNLLDAWGKALELARTTDALTARTKQYTDDKLDAPNKLQQVKDALKNYVEPAMPKPAPESKTPELEQALAAAQQEQKLTAKELADLDSASAARLDRRTRIPTDLAEVRKVLDALATQINDTALDPRLLAARSTKLAIERRERQAELSALQAELDYCDASTELKAAQRDLAARQAAASKAVAEAWQAIVQQRRTEDAQAAQAKAQRDAETAVRGLLQDLATRNAEIANQLPVLAEAQTRAEKDVAASAEDLRRLEQDSKDLKERAKVGSPDALGPLLRQRRARLPDDTRAQRREMLDLRQRIEQANLQYLQFKGMRDRLAEDPGMLDRMVAAAQPNVTNEVQRLLLPGLAAGLMQERRTNLQKLDLGWSNVLSDLAKVDASKVNLLRLSNEFRDFVNERVLWIRSSTPIWQLDWRACAEATGWLLAPANWLESASLLWSAYAAEPWQLFWLLLVVVALLFRPLLLRRLRQNSEAARRGQNVAYLPTALAFADTLLLALPVPVIFWLLAARLASSPDCSDFGRAIAAGANQSAWFLAVLLLIGRAVRADGLGEAHFQWRLDGLAVLRRNLKLLLPAAFPLTFALATIEQRANDDWFGSLGRLLLLPLLLLLLLWFWRVLHPQSGVAGGLGVTDKGWIHRFRRIWFLLGAGTPLTLLGMTLLGYDYTAMQLARRLEYTATVVLAGTLVHGLIARRLVLERRRLSIQQMKARLAAAKAGADPAVAAAEAAAGQGSDPSKLTQQTQTLLYGAISLVVVLLALQFWVDVLPALGVLHNVRLWGDEAATPPVVITLADLLLSLLLLLATTVAARNLPGLLELLVLQRLRIQAGERNAITTLARYALVIVGLVASFSAIGIGWSKVQWLIAGVSVGLGFGLQEIFANFVSGLILLFERPVRVGDVVTVGTVVGRVTRIRIRATTIQDWDRKELVVPNREFVTGQFVNWTLTDPIVRLTTKIGVAYGSNTEQALQLLLQAARESKYPLREPAPRAVFTSFGDSSLDLELRLFVDNFDDIPAMQTDVNQRIDRMFREHGIEMAFPQHDLHLRSAQPLVDFLRRDSHAETH